MLLDSNIIIYSAIPEHGFLLDFITKNSPYVSDISRVEVLGYRNLEDYLIEYFDSFFNSTTLISITDEIIIEAIKLRQRRKMNLGDSLVAATAIVNNFALVTNNTKDFKWIDSLTLINPFEN